MEESLHRLVYVSSACAAMSGSDLERLLAGARARNKAQDVTGALLFSGGNFMQVLEGSREAVRSVFERIGGNPAHHQVMELVCEPVPRREFADWSMAFSHASWDRLQQMQQAFGPGHDDGMDLLRSFWSGSR